MMDPQSVVPGSIMPAYAHMFDKNADLETAYAEAFTVKEVFGVPYDQEGMPKLGSYEDAKAEMLKEAEAIAADMKDPRVKEALKNGEVKHIVALIAYLNSLGQSRRGQ